MASDFGDICGSSGLHDKVNGEQHLQNKAFNKSIFTSWNWKSLQLFQQIRNPSSLIHIAELLLNFGITFD